MTDIPTFAMAIASCFSKVSATSSSNIIFQYDEAYIRLQQPWFFGHAHVNGTPIPFNQSIIIVATCSNLHMNPIYLSSIQVLHAQDQPHVKFSFSNGLRHPSHPTPPNPPTKTLPANHYVTYVRYTPPSSDIPAPRVPHFFSALFQDPLQCRQRRFASEIPA